MSTGQKRIIVWAVMAVIAFVVIRRLGIAALFQSKGPGQPSAGGGGPGLGWSPGADGVTAPMVSPTPVGPSQAHTGGDGQPVGLSSLHMTPAVRATPGPNGGTIFDLAPSVAANAPTGAFRLVAPTSVYSPTPNAKYSDVGRTVTDPKTGIAYDPVFGLYDVGAINRNAYASSPGTAPAQGDVVVHGTMIGTQTPSGFFGNPGLANDWNAHERDFRQ